MVNLGDKGNPCKRGGPETLTSQETSLSSDGLPVCPNSGVFNKTLILRESYRWTL